MHKLVSAVTAVAIFISCTPSTDIVTTREQAVGMLSDPLVSIQASPEVADVIVQQCTITMGASEDSDSCDLPIAANDTDKAFCFIATPHRGAAGPATPSGAGYNTDDLGAQLTLTDADTVTVSRPSAGANADMVYPVQCWFYQGSGGGAEEFIVRQVVTTTFPDSDGLEDASYGAWGISDVSDVTPIIMSIEGAQTGKSMGSTLVAIETDHDADARYRLRREHSSGQTIVKTAFVEWVGSDYTVYGNDSEIGHAHNDAHGSPHNETISSITWGKCFPFLTWRAEQHNGDDWGILVREGSAATNVQFDSTSTGVGWLIANVYILCSSNEDFSVNHLNSIDADYASFASDDQSVQYTAPETESLKSTGLLCHQISDTIGNAYPDSHWGYFLSDDTPEDGNFEINFRRGRTGQTGESSCALIKFPFVAEVIDPPPTTGAPLTLRNMNPRIGRRP